MRDEYGNEKYQPESELSKLATLSFLVLTLAAIQLALFHFAYEVFGIVGAGIVFALLIAGWIRLFDYNPGIGYYQKRYGLRPGTLHQPSKEATPCGSNVLPS